MFYFLYSTPLLPRHWIAWASDHQFYAFPTNPGGWRERQVYHPHAPLTPTLTETARIVAAGSGHEVEAVQIISLDDARSYRLPEAARATGVNEDSLRTACWHGRIQDAVSQGRRWRLTARALHRYIARYKPRSVHYNSKHDLEFTT